MDRRTFFRLGAGAAIALALDPERALWVPGQKTYFLPSPQIRPAIGDFVAFVEAIHGPLGSSFMDREGNRYVRVATGAMRTITPKTAGSVGVVSVYDRDHALLMVDGVTPKGVGIYHPWVGGAQ